MSEVSRRPGWSRQRVGVGVLIVLAVLAGAATWTVTYFEGQEVRAASVASRAAIVGTWKMQGDAGRIWFGADGRFSATALPNELFTLNQSQGGVTNTTGTWTLNGGGGYVALVPVGSPSGTGPDIALGVVETNHVQHLCVFSGSPGVRCDFLLQKVSG
jgi:hypothetical protein